MAKYNKENLEKLLKLIKEISSDPDNLWFKKKLSKDLNKDFGFENFPEFVKFQKKTFRIKGNNFYSQIKNNQIKNDLLKDYIEMCWYQSMNNMNRFMLFTFYQMENLLNFYCTNENCYEKLEKSPKEYIIDYGNNFIINCHKSFIKYDSKRIDIEKVTIWAKIVFWAIDSKLIHWEKQNHTSFSNLINIRNIESHRNSLNQNLRAEKTIQLLKTSDFSSLGFYIGILKKIKTTIK